MTTISKKHSLLMVATAVSLSLIIPGCSLFDKSGKKSSTKSSAKTTMVDVNQDQDDMDDSSRAIVTMSGKPLITEDRLEREKQNLMDSNPQVKQMMAMMPAGALDRNLAEGLTNQEVMALYIKDKEIDQSPVYKTELSRAMKSIPQALNVQFFLKDMNASVTDGAVKAFYDANKNVMPELMLSPGGVVAQGVSFANQTEAQTFLERVKAANGDMQKIAQEMHVAGEFEDFKLVNNQSMNIGTQLREKIMALTTVPSISVVSADSKFWVVKAIAKEPVKYREFESIKNDLRQYLGQKKAEEEISRLKKEYNIVIDDSFFAATANDAQSSLDDMSVDEDEAMDMTMEEGSDQEAHNKYNAQMRTTSAA